MKIIHAKYIRKINCYMVLVYRATVNSGTYVLVKDTTSTSFKDTMLHINTQYWYEVRGYYTAAGNMRDSTDYSPYGNGTTKNWFEIVFDLKGYGYSVCQTMDSGFVMTGIGDDSLIILKTNKSGDLLWVKKYDEMSTGSSIQKTSDEGFIIAGDRFREGTWDMYFIKTNHLGEFDNNNGWTKTIQGFDGGACYGKSVVETTDKGFIATGFISWDTTYLLKLDINGNGLWEKRYSDYGGSSFSVIQTKDGGYNIATIGGFLIKTDNQGNTSNSGVDKWVKNYFGEFYSHKHTIDEGYIAVGKREKLLLCVKTNMSGDTTGLGWVKTFPGRGEAEGTFVCITNDNCYVIIGKTKSSTSNQVIYTIKIDQAGLFVWDKTYGNERYGQGNSIQQTKDNGYIICGSIRHADGNDRIYLLKTDENGNIGN